MYIPSLSLSIHMQSDHVNRSFSGLSLRRITLSFAHSHLNALCYIRAVGWTRMPCERVNKRR